MPDIKYGSADVAAMKVGTTNVNRVMLGDFEVWPGSSGCVEVLIEDFDNFTDAPWVTTNAPTIQPGRTGAAMQSSGGQRAEYTIPADKRTDTLMVGFAWRYTDNVYSSLRHILGLWSDNGTFEQNRLTYTPSSSVIQFTRGDLVLANAGSIALVRNIWYFIEVQVKLSNTNGFVIVRLNGVPVIEAGGIDTNNGGGMYDRIRLNSVTANCVGQWDDFYLSSGAACTFPPVDTGPSSFPIIASFSTAFGKNALLPTPTLMPNPTGVTPGDLLIALCSADGGPDVRQSTGWSFFADSTSTGGHGTRAWARIADGSDALYLYHPHTVGYDYCFTMLRVTGHGVINLGRDLRAAGSALGTSFTPDPPILNGGNPEMFLWIAVAGLDRVVSDTIYAPPSGFTMIGATLHSANDTTSVAQAVAQRNQQVQTLDPAPFSATANRLWGCLTIAVPGP